MQEVIITISGRIPKYFFGCLKKKTKSEAQKLINDSNVEIEDMQEFLSLFTAMSMENSEEAKSDFKDRIKGFEKFEKHCPELFSIMEEIESVGMGHFRMYELLFDTPRDWEGGNAYMSFFEDDAAITVQVDGVKIVDTILLKDFSQSVFGFNTGDEPSNENEKNLGKWIKAFAKKNKKAFGLGDEIGASVNAQGARFMELWFTPPALDTFASKDDQVVIEHDDIIDYNFQFEAEAFSFDDLAFLAHANYGDFRGSACPTIANYVFYKHELLIPDETWHRDKGITLTYASDGLDTLTFLLNG